MNSTKAILVCATVAAAAAGAAMTNETTAVVATNAPVATVATNVAPEFSIPKSLVLRMYEAEDSFRDRSLAGPDGKPPFNDLLEFVGLTACGDDDLAFAAKDRPRGTMALVPDGLTDEERRKLWPFDIAGFERELERRMVRGEDGCYRLRDEDGTEVAANPTIRWANAEIASWATRELDRCSPRLTPRECEALLGSEEMPEGAAAWRLDPQHCFLLETGDGAWNPRTYTFLLWDGTNDPSILASFDSFPGDREAVAALLLGHRASSANNLAVLEWRHQSLRDSMIPGRIRQFLELARDAGVPVAERNLEVLRSHLPEVFADPEPPDADTKEYVVKEGDDIYSIAMKHDVTPLVLRRLNPGKDLAELSPGDRIRVPADRSEDLRRD